MVAFTGIRHIHLKVADVERSVRFYEQAIGMVHVMDKHDSRMVILATPAGDDILTVSHGDLTPELAGTADPSTERVGDNGGIDHFGFALGDQSDFDAAVEQICAAGGEVVDRGELAPGWPTAFLRDPDGYVFQI
jgi:catechol 2,3-dioxygenase-like lactoylglutathione lyase family enzyme